eukprot:gene5737-6926_t
MYWQMEADPDTNETSFQEDGSPPKEHRNGIMNTFFNANSARNRYKKMQRRMLEDGAEEGEEEPQVPWRRINLHVRRASAVLQRRSTFAAEKYQHVVAPIHNGYKRVRGLGVDGRDALGGWTEECEAALGRSKEVMVFALKTWPNQLRMITHTPTPSRLSATDVLVLMNAVLFSELENMQALLNFLGAMKEAMQVLRDHAVTGAMVPILGIKLLPVTNAGVHARCTGRPLAQLPVPPGLMQDICSVQLCMALLCPNLRMPDLYAISVQGPRRSLGLNDPLWEAIKERSTDAGRCALQRREELAKLMQDQAEAQEKDMYRLEKLMEFFEPPTPRTEAESEQNHEEGAEDEADVATVAAGSSETQPEPSAAGDSFEEHLVTKRKETDDTTTQQEHGIVEAQPAAEKVTDDTTTQQEQELQEPEELQTEEEEVVELRTESSIEDGMLNNPQAAEIAKPLDSLKPQKANELLRFLKVKLSMLMSSIREMDASAAADLEGFAAALYPLQADATRGMFRWEEEHDQAFEAIQLRAASCVLQQAPQTGTFTHLRLRADEDGGVTDRTLVDDSLYLLALATIHRMPAPEMRREVAKFLRMLAAAEAILEEASDELTWKLRDVSACLHVLLKSLDEGRSFTWTLSDNAAMLMDAHAAAAQRPAGEGNPKHKALLCEILSYTAAKALSKNGIKFSKVNVKNQPHEAPEQGACMEEVHVGGAELLQMAHLAGPKPHPSTTWNGPISAYYPKRDMERDEKGYLKARGWYHQTKLMHLMNVPRAWMLMLAAHDTCYE